MNLTELAQYAAGTAQRASNKPLHELSIEEARKVIKIVDGNKIKKANEQALVLKFGQRLLILDAISNGATRLNVPTANVEAVKTTLAAHVSNGDFDEAIKQAQTAIKEAKLTATTKAKTELKQESPVNADEKAALVEPVEAKENPAFDTPNVDGLDLSSI